MKVEDLYLGYLGMTNNLNINPSQICMWCKDKKTNVKSAKFCYECWEFFLSLLGRNEPTLFEFKNYKINPSHYYYNGLEYLYTNPKKVGKK